MGLDTCQTGSSEGGFWINNLGLNSANASVLVKILAPLIVYTGFQFYVLYLLPQIYPRSQKVSEMLNMLLPMTLKTSPPSLTANIKKLKHYKRSFN